MKENDKIQTINNMPLFGDYLVIMYGSVVKKTNDSNIPNIHVILRKVDIENNLLFDNKYDVIAYIPVGELDIVRIGSVWRNQKLVYKSWLSHTSYEYKTQQFFSFDCTDEMMESLKYNDYIEELQSTISDAYPVNIDPKEKNRKYIIGKSRYTKLIDRNNITVLIPSIELFTSTYTPDHKEIRERLLQYDLDTALDKFVEGDKCRIKDETYIIRINDKKLENNLRFLAFAKLNETSRKRIKVLSNSLEYDTKDMDGSSTVRYPTVLPFHPTLLEIKCDGIWLNDKVFLVYRIDDRNIPDDFYLEVEREIEDKQETEKTVGPNGEQSDDSESSDDDTTHTEEADEQTIDSNKTPSKRNRTQQIVTEVGVIGRNKPIKYRTIRTTKEVTKKVIDENLPEEEPKKTSTLEENIVDTLSSGEVGSSNEASNVAKLVVIGGSEKYNEDSQKLFDSIYEALNKIKKDNEKKLVNFHQLSSQFESCEFGTVTTFYSTLRIHEQPKDILDDSWCRLQKRDNKKHELEKLGNRGYLLVHLNLQSAKNCYLLEIGKKDNEHFCGVLFCKSDYSEFRAEEFAEILKKIVEKKGFHESVLGDEMKSVTYKHFFSKRLKKYKGLDKTIKRKFGELGFTSHTF